MQRKRKRDDSLLSGNPPQAKRRTPRKKHDPKQPYWNDKTAHWSKDLWSCSATNSANLHQEEWDPSLQALSNNSWFTVSQTVATDLAPKSQPIWSNGYFDQPKHVIKEEEDKPTISGVRKIRIHPNQKQQQILKQWMDAKRWTYNRSVAYLNDEATKEKRTLKHLREHSVSNEALNLIGKNEWLGAIPYAIRDEGVRDATKALSSNIAKRKLCQKRGQTHNFKLRFQTKKGRQQDIVIHKTYWKRTRGIYFHLLGTSGSKLNAAEPLPADLPADCRLLHNQLNEWCLCIPQYSELWSESQAPDKTKHSVVALDPGVRTFMTVYSPDGAVTEWGVGDATRLQRLCKAIDSLKSRSTEVSHHKRYRMKKAVLRIHKKIRNLVDEVQRKLIKWLMSEFRVVLLPKFETQGMVTKGKRKLNSKTARTLCTWSHYRFKSNLMRKARLAPWFQVIETTEEFTSKTCGLCGHINEKLGSSKTFVCPKCQYTTDRDFNGARNILLRHLTTTTRASL